MKDDVGQHRLQTFESLVAGIMEERMNEVKTEIPVAKAEMLKELHSDREAT
jgi:hypothetical protein